MSEETANYRMPVDDEQVVELSTVTKNAIDDIALELQETKALSLDSKNKLGDYLPLLRTFSIEGKDEGYYAKASRLLKDAD